MNLRDLVLRWLRMTVVGLVTLALGALVAATVYWTAFDPRWITFLGGVLFAAVLAVASQVSRAEWRAARRLQQLERMRSRMEEQASRGRAAEEAVKSSELRLRVLADALPQIVLFVDRTERCTYANRAAAQKAKLPLEACGHRALGELMGEAAVPALAPLLGACLGGAPMRGSIEWGESTYAVQATPYPGGACLVFSEERAEERPGAEEQSAESLHVEALATQGDGWDDPQEKLLRALRDNEFLLLQQRIEPLAASGEPMYEILLRLREEEDNLLPPGGFFPAAERFGMMEALDRWVVTHLVTRCLERQLGERGWRAPLYCVNLSGAALASPDFGTFVRDQIAQRKFDAGRLCFEIAEPDLIAQPSEARRLVVALKPIGCRFTVDAFGSAKASFGSLKGIPFDFLKIDGVIVQNLVRNPAELARARAIATVCHRIGVRTIAEFVEDDATRARLGEIGVDYVQGFGVARPEPLHAPGNSRPVDAGQLTRVAQRRA